jgi:arylsulfatase A-like enzyme
MYEIHSTKSNIEASTSSYIPRLRKKRGYDLFLVGKCHIGAQPNIIRKKNIIRRAERKKIHFF